MPSAFYDHFTPRLARMMGAVLTDLMAGTMAIERELDGILSSFRDVPIIDSTLIRPLGLIHRAEILKRMPHVSLSLARSMKW